MNSKTENRLRNIIRNNFGVKSVHIALNVNFMTLIPSTYAMKGEVKKFISGLRKRYDNFMYIATIKKSGSNTFRCDMVCNPDIAMKDVELWHNGNAYKAKIDSFESLDEVIEILVSDVQSTGIYIHSRNLRHDNI